MNSSLAITLGLGFALGLRHATEADHLAAVSAIVGERRSLIEAARVGGLWGLGHTAALLAAGFFVIVLGLTIPERLANWLELGVAVMIVGLGTRLLYLVFRGRSDIHVHAHTHNGATHSHLHFHDASDAHALKPSESAGHNVHSGFSGWRPLLVGVVHGLAGSAALTLLVLSEISRDHGMVLGLAYLAVFGAGSIGGMALMSLLIGLPFSLAPLRRAALPLQAIAGLASAVFGIAYAWEIAIKL